MSTDWMDAIGPTATDKLAQVYGGCKYLVPPSTETRAGHELTAMIGGKAATALVGLAAGDTIYIPQGVIDERAARVELIEALHRGGMSPNRISQLLCFTARYSERHVRHILQSCESDQGAAG